MRTVELEEGKQRNCSPEDIIITNPDNLDVSAISPFTHGAADTRIFVHLNDAVRKGCSNITIRATDRDMVILASTLFEDIVAQKLWVNFGTNKRLRVVPIKTYLDIHKRNKTNMLIRFFKLKYYDESHFLHMHCVRNH